MKDEKFAITKIAVERIEQLEKHHRSIRSDYFNNRTGQLRDAASYLIILQTSNPEEHIKYKPKDWDAQIWLRMCAKSYEERLIIAGALVAAEIDRINYKPN